MKVSLPCAAALALFPLVSAFPAPTAAPGELDIIKYGLDVLEARELQPRQGSGVVSLPLPSTDVSTSRTSASSSSSQPPPSSSSSPSTSPSPTSERVSTPPPPSSTPTPTSPPSSPPVIRTSTSKTEIESTQENGVVVTSTIEVIVSSVESTTAAPPDSPPAQNNSGSSGVSTSTIVGLSVAGGLAALGLIAFIAWKLTRKRFSQFDNDDGVINWPDLKKDQEPELPAPSVRAASTTTSTVELVKDPYAVPPLPQNNNLGPYRGDPAGYYDPYRGPIPQTFATPPASTDGHQQGWAGGEAIPMSTYSSGRTSPGPNYAYGGVDPMQRTGTPVQRMATPVQRMATPVGGATFQEIARSGTPGGGAVPYRTGTPGYGYGGR